MRVTVTTEHHFVRTPDGAVYSETGGRGYRFWTRYLSTFDEVRVVGRVRDAEQPCRDGEEVEGRGVRCIGLPTYRGPVEYLARSRALRRATSEAARSHGAFVLRVPGQIGSLVWSGLGRRSIPYAVEVVGDPREVFARGSVRSFARIPARFAWSRRLRAQCSGATVAAYVTRSALQQRYPPGNSTAAYHVPEVDLPPEAYIESPRRFSRRATRLVSVGSLAQMYKGPDVLLRALALSAVAGQALEVCWVGDGVHRSAMEALARSLGLAPRVQFVGQVACGAGVRRHLDAADLFVLASRTEGLPRALLEAMARGLPCVATRVGGVPELLDEEVLVHPGRPEELARVLTALCTSPSTLDRLGSGNLERARTYSNQARASVLAEFLRRVRSTANPGVAPQDSGHDRGAVTHP